MCGIAGFLNYKFDDPFFENVNNIQQHRGPNAQDLIELDRLRLYHQRLSIIDLSVAANQPFRKNGLTIVFNGEIYNYRALRETLIKDHKVSFTTSSDTEVLLEMYQVYGIEALPQFKGMFAFAIYDEHKKVLILARDAYGIKPLFYYSKGDKFAFSSELKTLIGLPGLNKSINSKSLVAAMNFLWLPGNNSIFQEIQKLPGGHFAKVTPDGNINIQKFSQPIFDVVINNENKAIERLDTLLQESVDRHLESDVPISSFLSGGLDSSLLSVLAAKKQPLSTYSIAFEKEDNAIEQMSNDAAYARKLAGLKGFDHNEILITPDILTELPNMVYHLDEPLGDPAAINTYLISKAAADNGVRVLLSGMGADEMFFGYRRQKATLWAMKYRKLPGLFRTATRNVANYLPVKAAGRGIMPVRWAQRFLSFSDLPPSQAYMRSYSYYDKDSINQLFIDDATNPYNEILMDHHQTFTNEYENDIINRMCYTDLHYFMQGLNLTYTDRASMAASVEVRVPFIDTEVINLAMSMSGNLKYKNGLQKYILKKVAEKHLPKEIIYRPKASFGAPIRSWISGELKPMVDDLLNYDTVKRRGIFNPAYVEKMISDDRRGKHDYAYQIYMLLSTELWFQQFIDN